MMSADQPDLELAAVLGAIRRAFAAGGDDRAAALLGLDLAILGEGERPRFFRGDDLQAERIFRRIDERLGRAEGQRMRQRWRRRPAMRYDRNKEQR